jgi:hypothetical protein
MLPALLAQNMIQEAYRKLVDRRDWSWLRAEGEFLINNSTVGTATVTYTSPTVTNPSITLPATDAGRQFRIGMAEPVYTIISVNTTANTYTLDRPYGGTSGTAEGFTVGDWYLTLPLGFKSFITVLDPVNNWQLRYFITEEELNAWDAQRSATGTPWAVVSRRLSTYAPTVGQVQYEIWPYPTTQRNYPYYYYLRAGTLTDSTQFLGVLANRADLLVTGGLALAAEWPGLEGRPNPYFNLGLAKMKWEEFNAEADRLEVLDEETYMTWFEEISWINRMPWAPIDSKYNQNHDVGGGWAYGAPWPH